MNKVLIRALNLSILVSIITFYQSELAQAEMELEAFTTENGKCSLTQKSELLDKTDGALHYSYNLTETEIFPNRGLSRGTGTIIPPLTRLNCLVKSGRGKKYKMLVTAANNESYCGWIDADRLLEASGGSDLAFGSDTAPCGVIKAISIRNFCTQIKETLGDVEGCSEKSVGRSIIKTKFITDNTSNAALERSAETEKIVLYSSAQTMNQIGTVDIFTILEVFDQAKNNQTGAIRLLVGINGKSLKGWIDYNSGTVWYSNLSTYFSAKGLKGVYKSKIGVRNNQVLAERPKNLQQTLDGNREFSKFPVLFDYRVKTAITPAKIKPHLQVAFIGRFCGEGQATLCSANNEAPQNVTNLNSADIMFLIDGSKSMKKYFKLVSKAVANFTDNYVDDPDYRFGVTMYGDFKDKSKTKTKDAIDFEVVHELQLNFGDLFNSLDQTALFIKDVMKDKEEATDAAIYNAVNKVRWKENRLRFMIHIGDHGDRVDPSDLTLRTMRENNIFYIPVAVRGEGLIGASDKFVKNAELIFKKHRTDGNIPMALEPIVTYRQNMDEYEAIAQALVGSLTTGKEAERVRRADIFGGNTGPISTANTLPPGFALLTQAAKELFLPEASDGALTSIAAKGYVETAAIGITETDWDYFVTLDAAELLSLNRSMQSVCRKIGGSNDDKTITESIRQMIEALTGDRLTSDELPDYWKDRDSIPLVTQTLLGNGMKEFLRDSGDPTKLSKYKQGFCRGYELTKLMMNKKKLPNPYHGQSLKWNGDYYESEGALAHNWLYKDLFERGYYYLPLTYLPTHGN